MELHEALMATAELCGTNLSEPAAQMMVDDLGKFPAEQLLLALRRCRLELKGRLTIAEIVNRINDGRPGPDEAWAMIPRDEWVTVVWTRETSNAWAVAQASYDNGDKVGSARAFREKYIELVAEARHNGEAPAWIVSIGWDRHGRIGPVEEAVDFGRITSDYAFAVLPGEWPERHPEALPPGPAGPRFRLDGSQIGLTITGEETPDTHGED